MIPPSLRSLSKESSRVWCGHHVLSPDSIIIRHTCHVFISITRLLLSSTHNISITMATSDLEKQPLLEAEHNTVASSSDDQTPEPTLSELQQNVFKAQRAYMRAWSRTTSGKWHKRIMFSVTGLLLFIMLSCMAMIAADALSEDDMVYHSGKVQLDAFIMSKCPDARDCLHDMVLPAMQQISHKVDFRLNYIGRYGTMPVPSTTNPY